MDTEDYPKYAEQLKKLNNYILIDLPDRLDDESLIPVLKDAHYIIWLKKDRFGDIIR